MPNLPWPSRPIMQLSIIGSAFGQQIVTVHHFEAQTAFLPQILTDSTLQAEGANLAASWISVCKAAYLGCLAVDYGMLMVRAQGLERTNQWNHRLTPTEDPETGAGTGGGSQSTEVTTTAAVLRWRTPQAGKSHRGRTYFGPIPSSFNTDGRLATTGVTALTAYRDAILGQWGADRAPASATWVLTVYSKPFNKGTYGYPKGTHPNMEIFYPEDYAGQSTNINTGAVDPILRTQRRREVGVGA